MSIRSKMSLHFNHSPQYHVYPESSRFVAEKMENLLFMFTSDMDLGVLRGYGLNKQKNELVARELWTVNLMKHSQTITNVVTKRQNGKFKYRISPNISTLSNISTPLFLGARKYTMS